MRQVERIDNFLAKVDWNYLMDRWKVNKDLVKSICYASNPTVPEYWKENPDQRIGQVLINLNLIPDDLFIWNDEEHEILLDQGVPMREVYTWTSYYDKDKNRLATPVIKFIKDLDTDHVENIIEHLHGKEEHRDWLELMQEELKFRKDDTKRV